MRHPTRLYYSKRQLWNFFELDVTERNSLQVLYPIGAAHLLSLLLIGSQGIGEK